MKQNLRQLIDRARTKLADTNLPQLFTDKELTGHYNEAIDEACLRIRGILDSTTAKLCNLQANPNQQRYPLDPRIISIERVRVGHNPVPLEFKTLRWLDTQVEYWDSPQRAGIPQWYFTDQDKAKNLVLCIVPYPQIVDSMNLSVWRMPLDSEYLQNPEDVPPLPFYLHEGLVDWVEHRAYGKFDSQTYDQKRSERALADFTARYGPRPTGLALRRVSTNALRGVKPLWF